MLFAHPLAASKDNSSRILGFSMIELMVAVSITGIIATLAMPSFNQLIRNTQVRADAASLHAYLSFARKYAITNQTNVHLCQRPISGALQCDIGRTAGRSWNSGWIVFEDKNRNNTVEDDEILKIMSPLNTSNVRFNQRGKLRFHGDGSARSAGFYIFSEGATAMRHISILHTGRVRIRDKLPLAQRVACKSAWIHKKPLKFLDQSYLNKYDARLLKSDPR